MPQPLTQKTVILLTTLTLLSCYTPPKPEDIINCNKTPKHWICSTKCYKHCTRSCEKYPDRCTLEQLQELKETGRILDKNDTK